MFFKIGVLKNFAPKDMTVLETLFNKVVGLFFVEHLWWLLLQVV